MNTIPCYDRFAPHKRWAFATLLIAAAVAALALQPAQAAPAAQQLPRVVVMGESLQTQAARAARAQSFARSGRAQLPRVLVVAHRPQQVALSLPRPSDY